MDSETATEDVPSAYDASDLRIFRMASISPSEMTPSLLRSAEANSTSCSWPPTYAARATRRGPSCYVLRVVGPRD
eukprot:5041162-Prymnesium_polylepis.1